jgi:hypothetical protein
MLGRKDFTRSELDQARASVAAQLAVYRRLVGAVCSGGKVDANVDAALRDLQAVFFNTLVVALDRPFVHRVRVVCGKDGNPLNEVELIVDSLLNNGGVFRGNNVIKYVPEEAVVHLEAGDRIQLSEPQFEALAGAFFAELERRFT